MPIFNQNGKVLIFGLNLGKLPNYVQHFDSHNVEGVAENWVEAGGEQSWVEVDGGWWIWMELGTRFSNTLKQNGMLENSQAKVKVKC